MLPLNIPGQVNSSFRFMPLAHVHTTDGQPWHFLKLIPLPKLKEYGHQPFESVIHKISYLRTENCLSQNYNIAINTVVQGEL